MGNLHQELQKTKNTGKDFGITWASQTPLETTTFFFSLLRGFPLPELYDVSHDELFSSSLEKQKSVYNIEHASVARSTARVSKAIN